MNFIETDWWVMALPPEWQAEQDEEAILVSDEDGVGTISLLVFVMEPGQSAGDAAKELIKGAGLNAGQGKAVTLADCPGQYFELVDDGEFVREWYLTAGEIVLLVSYCCDEDNAVLDREIVDQILATLQIGAPESDED